MALLIAIGSLTAGIILGVIATYRFSSTSPVKVRQLEQQIVDLQQAHTAYKEDVSSHFNTTAELVQQMTESYRDVYQHLASGAQTLCDHEVADKMLPAGERDRLFRDEAAPADDPDDSGNRSSPDNGPEPPRDYAERSGGALSEDYGLEKPGQKTGNTPAGQTGSAENKGSGAENGGKQDNRKDRENAEPAGDRSRSSDTLYTTDTPGNPGKESGPETSYRTPDTTEQETGPITTGDTAKKGAESRDNDRSQKG